MRKSERKIPKSMDWLFWSYDPESLDLRTDKEYIVTQVLNYGKWEDVQWLFRAYARKEIVEIVKNPGGAAGSPTSSITGRRYSASGSGKTSRRGRFG